MNALSKEDNRWQHLYLLILLYRGVEPDPLPSWSPITQQKLGQVSRTHHRIVYALSSLLDAEVELDPLPFTVAVKLSEVK